MDAEALQKFFEPFAAVTVKGMFGGRGVHTDGLMFALQAADKIYLKTDDISAPRFREAGSRPFVYRSPMGPRETSYWSMPAPAEADAGALKAWCAVALEAARRAAAAKGVKRVKGERPRSRGKGEPAKASGAKSAPRDKRRAG